MAEENPYGDRGARPGAEADERDWREGLDDSLELAEQALRETLTRYPDFFSIPAAELPELIAQAERYLGQDEDEQEPKIRRRALDIQSLPEAKEVTAAR